MRRKKFSAIQRAGRADFFFRRAMRLPHVIENLESRRLLSLSIDMRIDMGNAANTDPASIIDDHTISGAQVGDVYALQIWAVMHGSDTISTNDSLDLLYGSLVASDLRTGGYFGAVQGSFAVPTLEPYFDAAEFNAGPGVQYPDANGNVNVGSATENLNEAQLFFHPVVDSTQSLPPTNSLGAGAPGAGQEEELATTTFTVTQVVSGPPVTLEFALRPQISGEVSAIWYEDGAPKDTLDLDTVAPSTGITITEPDTIAPTASATLGPILGSTSAYQFAVNYSDNQDLNTNDFGDNNILVTGPNGYSQLATYMSDADADPSADPQYDPYNATYQITPPDGTWSAADNGAYTFTLESNQIADTSSNFAGTTALGGGPLDVDFLGAVSIAPATAEIGENAATPAMFTVTRTDGASDNFAEPMTVAYSTEGTAAAGTNYVALSGSVTIPAGQSSASISVQPMDDQVADADTALLITLSPGSSYTLGSPTGAGLTIDNTDLPTVSISPATAEVDENSVTPAAFTVSRANDDLAHPLTVDYSTSSSAVAGTNYTALSGSIIIPTGQTSATISVQPIDDNVVDSSTTLAITLAPESNYTLGTSAAATLTIDNTDGTTVSISPATAEIEETSGPSSFTVTRTASPNVGYADPLTVTYTTSGSAVAGANYSPLTGSVTILAGQTSATISIQPMDDKIAGDNSIVQITLTGGNGYSLGARATAALTIDNVDIAPTSNPAITSNPGISDSPIGDMNIAPGSAAGSINLANIFTNNYLAGDTIVQMQTSQGAIDLELFNSQAPATVQNFLSYLNSGQYNNTLFYRADSGFVIQTGADYPVDENNNNFTSATPGDTVVGNINSLGNSPTIQNEYSDMRPNVEGTIAMAKISGEPNSASTEWFINLGDNSENLDNQNSGFTVFGQVIGTGMNVAQTIGNLPTLASYGGSGNYAELPLANFQNGNIEADNLVLVPTMSVIPAVSYSVSSTNTGIVNPSLSGANLSLAYGSSGTALVTITATDVLGDTKTETFNVTVQPGAAPAINVSENNQAIASGQSGAVSFGNASVGAAGSPVSFTIANTGNVPLTLAALSITGGFKLVSPPASQSIAPGASETFTVTMPTTAAATLDGNITFTTNDPNNPNFSIPISGVVSEPDTAPTLSTAAAASFTAASAGSFTISTTGFPVAALSESGTLPSGVTFTDNANGSATLAGTPAAGSAGIYDLIVTASNGVSPDATQDFVLTVNSPPGDSATQLAFITQPQSATSGTPFTLSVAVEDADGNIVTSDNSTVSLGVVFGLVGLDGTLSAVAVNGVATFNNVIVQGTGTCVLSASDGSLSEVLSNAFPVSYASPQLVFAQHLSSVAAGKTFSLQVDTDNTGGGISVSGKSKITVKILSGPAGGKISGKNTVTSKEGVAKFSNLSITRTGTYTLEAFTSSGFAAGESTLTVTPGAAAKIEFDPQPGNASASAPFNVSVELFDRYGNLAAGDTSTVHLALGTHPKGTTMNVLSENVADGSADFDGITLDTAGNYSLKASDGKLKATSKKFLVS